MFLKIATRALIYRQYANNIELTFAELYKTKMVEIICRSTFTEREQWIREANYNLFTLKSDPIYNDFLTDSETGAMSDRQWSALMLGDERNAGARLYYVLRDAISDLPGFDILYQHIRDGQRRMCFFRQ
ncbi:MAG: tryptophanase [Bacteroidetes bacterium]|nr:tryptophanase [Bacteroidota bacterium]